MVLGYRSYVEVAEPTTGIGDLVLAQLQAWLVSKRYDAGAARVGALTDVAATARLLLLDEEDDAGNRVLGARLVEEPSPGETWTTELTAVLPTDEGRARLLVDVVAPGAVTSWASRPRLVAGFLATLPVHDGAGRLAAEPVRVGRSDVDAVVAALTDPRRRGLVLVAGSSRELPAARWYEYVAKILRESTGLAATYFLDPAATTALAARLGETHAVRPGTVRTFLPAVRPGDGVDGLRHRYLSTDSILRSTTGRLGRMLGQRAREQALEQPLPAVMVAARQRLDALSDRLLLEEPVVLPATRPVATEPVAAEPAVAEPVLPEPVAPDLTVPSAALNVLRSVLGIDAPTDDDWLRLGELAVRGQSAGAAQARASGLVAELRTSLEQLTADRHAVVERLEDEQLEVAASYDELETLRARNAHLERLLVRTELAAEVWAEPESVAPPPDSFAELLDRWDELPGIRFTGDSDHALALDTRNPLGTWARKTWEALAALVDYRRVKAEQGFNGDVETFLQNLPDGCRGWSANRHARDESSEVANSPKLRVHRMLPVPPEYDESRVAWMGAHLKIAQSGRVSPRMHYLDATARTGEVYVGYIGAHLPLG